MIIIGDMLRDNPVDISTQRGFPAVGWDSSAWRVILLGGSGRGVPITLAVLHDAVRKTCFRRHCAVIMRVQQLCTRVRMLSVTHASRRARLCLFCAFLSDLLRPCVPLLADTPRMIRSPRTVCLRSTHGKAVRFAKNLLGFEECECEGRRREALTLGAGAD